MNPIHRFVWNLLMRRRRNLRYLAARFPVLAPWAVRARMAAHILFGNIHFTIALVLMFALPTTGLAWSWSFWISLGFLAVAELILQAGFYVGAGRFPGWLLWLVGWREGLAVRAYLPAAWADGAVKTPTVQAEVGTSSEPMAPAKLRPIADHPKLSFVPQVAWPTVSFWVGPPPGRTLRALDEMAEVLAAHLPRCHSVSVDYERARDSFGRISFVFADVLATPRPAQPNVLEAQPDPTVLGELPEPIEPGGQVLPFPNRYSAEGA